MSQMDDIIVKPKIYCGGCDCMVVEFEHALRCRTKSIKGWNDRRVQAWFGDTIHRLDVQLALKLRGSLPSTWESQIQTYASNASMAIYVRRVNAACLAMSDHSAATVFEASYSGKFRISYLFDCFPDVAALVVDAWKPPNADMDTD